MERGSGLLYKCVDEIGGSFTIGGVDMRGDMTYSEDIGITM